MISHVFQKKKTNPFISLISFMQYLELRFSSTVRTIASVMFVIDEVSEMEYLNSSQQQTVTILAIKQNQYFSNVFLNQGSLATIVYFVFCTSPVSLSYWFHLNSLPSTTFLTHFGHLCRIMWLKYARNNSKYFLK